MKHINQVGRSMIEMLGVLAIIGVLSVGGIAGYSKAMTKYRINKASDQISQLAQNIRTLYTSQKTYSTLSSTVIQRAHLAPEEMYEGTGSSTLTNPFGGSVWVYSSGKMYSGDNKAFYMYMTSVPQEACIELLTQDWGGGSSSGLIAFGTSGVTSKYYGCTTSSSTCRCADAGVMPVNDAVNACSSTTSNTIYWKFY